MRLAPKHLQVPALARAARSGRSAETAALAGDQTKLETVPLAHTRFARKREPKADLPPVVLIHGLLGSQMTYRSLVRREDFAPYRDILTVDLRNHGQSPHVSDMDLQTMSGDLLRYLDDQGLEKACFMGHSVGGKTAMIVALEHPERVSEIVVLDIAPSSSGSRMDTVQDVVRAMREVDVKGLAGRKGVEAALRSRGISDERIVQFVMTNLVGDSISDSYRWRLNIEAIYQGLVELRSFPDFDPYVVYPGPALFAYGAQSALFDESDGPSVRRRFPRAVLRRVENAGHWLQADNPAAVCAVIQDFLADD